MVTFKDIKNSNYSAIFHLIYHNEKLSKQEIAHQLQLSLPTITQNLVKLEKEQLIEKKVDNFNLLLDVELRLMHSDQGHVLA